MKLSTIDISAPGGIEALLAFHRATFGDARMEGDDSDSGGADTDDAGDTADDSSDDVDDDGDGADKLADAGKQALDRMKAQRNAERDRRRELERRIAELEKPKGDETDPEKLREQARAEARAEAARERVLDKIEAKAARGFADPEDAVAILLRSRSADDFLDDGKVDVEAIQDALDELLAKKPHLAAVQDGRRFRGEADGGTRKESRPRQLTRDDIERMSPEQIEKARVEGRLNDLLGIK